MKKESPTYAVFPTMITPYNKNGTVDYGAVSHLTEWYWKQGCSGIFAACQSSEIAFLSLADRVGLARTVREKADELARLDTSRNPMTIVASGHISYDKREQILELQTITDTGVDALILISNRMDIANTTDEAWITDTDSLLTQLPDTIPLGVYECPAPYKRLMSPAMLAWCAATGRFYFLKDTCCDAALIAERIKITKNSPLRLYNANAQTLLQSLQVGGAGYCGVMANFHPALYVWICQNFEQQPEKAEFVQAFLAMAAFTENLPYPITAKYHLNDLQGISMELFSRSRNSGTLTEYEKSCIRQMKELADKIQSSLG